jgi:hypothetical protein
MWEWQADMELDSTQSRHDTEKDKLHPDGLNNTPNCDIRPNTRKRAAVWLLAQIVIFRQEEYHISILRDYITYVKRRKDYLYMHPNRRMLVANYLLDVDKP